MGKKTIANLLSSVSILSLFLLIYSGSILYASFDGSFYEKEFEKLGVYSALRDYDVISLNQQVLSFLAGGNGDLPNDFFSQREISHLYDVRNIFSIVIIIFFISLTSLILSFIISIFIVKNRKMILRIFDRVFLMAALIVVFIDVILILALSIGFGASFDVFHKSFFSENSYLFNPVYEKIVVLYPEQLFYDAGMRILEYSFFAAFIFILMEIVVYFLGRRTSK